MKIARAPFLDDSLIIGPSFWKGDALAMPDRKVASLTIKFLFLGAYR